MIKMPLVAATLALAFTLPAAAGDKLEISGSPLTQHFIERHVEAIVAASGVTLDISAVGCGKAMLDLLDGKATVAAISMPLDQALDGAREQALAEGRPVVVPAGLEFHPVAYAGNPALSFVTVGAPPAELGMVLRYLRSSEGRVLVQAGL